MVINLYTMKIKLKNLIIIIGLGFCLITSVDAELTEKINNILNSQKNVQFSVHIVKADTGKTIYEHNKDKPLTPASNMKIITTAVALKTLGPDYTFKTQVGLCGDALVVIGSGDPLLGDKDTDAKYNRKPGWIFDDIIAKLKINGITSIQDIIIDTTIFDNQPTHPNWPKEQLNQWYACEVSGLNYNDNCIDIIAKNVDGKIQILLDPQTEYLKITNMVKPVKTGKTAIGAYRTEEYNKLILKGTCKTQEGPFTVAIEKPAGFFGFILAENLTKAGIVTKGQLFEKSLPSDCSFKPIADYNTPIADCIARCNKDSFGLAAEALLKTMAAKSNPNHKNGGWEQGRQVIKNYLLQLGLNKDMFFIDDASGLSKNNKLSANVITTVLLDVYNSENRKLYKDSLAVGGIDGTARKYFKEEKYKDKIFGKTGYISGVKSFSGICTAADGDYIFSIITNNANGKTRQAINDIVQAIIDSTPATTPPVPQAVPQPNPSL
jgi:serine-type D-Ala-D-Ala carboxypeptidase/endopeptidase (penicillin-binding protein 4)